MGKIFDSTVGNPDNLKGIELKFVSYTGEMVDSKGVNSLFGDIHHFVPVLHMPKDYIFTKRTWKARHLFGSMVPKSLEDGS